MSYIGIAMNKFIYFIFAILSANINMYWDLGVAVSNYVSSESQVNQSIDLSTYHRLEGLKKYYVDDFEKALVHFETLNESHKQLVLYEYINCYYALGNYNAALSILESYNNNLFSDNLMYLKSKILTMLGYYDEALFILNELKNNFPVSDYIDIIKFDLEKINLLK